MSADMTIVAVITAVAAAALLCLGVLSIATHWVRRHPDRRPGGPPAADSSAAPGAVKQRRRQ